MLLGLALELVAKVGPVRKVGLKGRRAQSLCQLLLDLRPKRVKGEVRANRREVQAVAQERAAPAVSLERPVQVHAGHGQLLRNADTGGGVHGRTV